MREHTIFIANDETRFETAPECIEYEAFLEKVRAVMAPLGKRPTTTNFYNNSDWIQRDKETIGTAKSTFIQLMLAKHYPEHVGKPASLAWIHRCCDGHNGNEVDRAIHRLSCFDESGREFGQPYFANNPDAVKGICVTAEEVELDELEHRPLKG